MELDSWQNLSNSLRDWVRWCQFCSVIEGVIGLDDLTVFVFAGVDGMQLRGKIASEPASGEACPSGANKPKPKDRNGRKAIPWVPLSKGAEILNAKLSQKPETEPRLCRWTQAATKSYIVLRPITPKSFPGRRLRTTSVWRWVAEPMSAALYSSKLKAGHVRGSTKLGLRDLWAFGV